MELREVGTDMGLLLWAPSAFLGLSVPRKVASTMGRPISMDEATTKQTRIDFSRRRVDINADGPLPKEVWVKVCMHVGLGVEE